MIKFLEENLILTKVILVLLLLVVCGLLIFFGKKKEEKFNVRKMSIVGIFSALSVALYFIKIPFPVFSFLEIQFSNVPSYIIGFLLGPYYGILTVCIRTIIKIPMTHTLCIGEMADLIIGVLVIGISSIFYHKDKTRKNAILSLIIGCGVWVISAVILNWTLLLPVYMELFFDSNPSTFIEVMNLADTFKNINEQNYLLYYLLIGIVPFNFFLSALSSIITMLVYKRISILYHNDKKVDLKSE